MAEQVYAIEMIPSGWITIVGGEAAELHGVKCIKGRWLTNNRDNWAAGRTVYVPVAHIKSVTIHDSEAEYFEAGKRQRLSDFPKDRPES